MNSFTFTYLSQGSTLQVRFRLRSELKTRLLALILTITKKKPIVFEKKSLGVSSLEKKIWLSGELTLTSKED